MTLALGLGWLAALLALGLWGFRRTHRALSASKPPKHVGRHRRRELATTEELDARYSACPVLKSRNAEPEDDEPEDLDDWSDVLKAINEDLKEKETSR